MAVQKNMASIQFLSLVVSMLGGGPSLLGVFSRISASLVEGLLAAFRCVHPGFLQLRLRHRLPRVVKASPNDG
ncbi:hypothetical protein RHGRI_025880 [Rhododendron griersonianum]|uniref:Uncharacterized protein n=1 Tax=Rhododendron griersonianum TaxID=479676 RepID=A0AAV6IUB8_9ERIC|nr:hypothetical protein RHGRI_025880 [Rhododendron griersonianum]